MLGNKVPVTVCTLVRVTGGNAVVVAGTKVSVMVCRLDMVKVWVSKTGLDDNDDFVICSPDCCGTTVTSDVTTTTDPE